MCSSCFYPMFICTKQYIIETPTKSLSSSRQIKEPNIGYHQFLTNRQYRCPKLHWKQIKNQQYGNILYDHLKVKRILIHNNCIIIVYFYTVENVWQSMDSFTLQKLHHWHCPLNSAYTVSLFFEDIFIQCIANSFSVKLNNKTPFTVIRVHSLFSCLLRINQQ